LLFNLSTNEEVLAEGIVKSLVNSGGLSPWEPGVLSLVIFGLMVMAIIGLLLFIASWLGEKKPTTEKLRPYESGVIPTGSARLRYPVPFYLVAIFFLLFDVEAAYIFAWAIAWEKLGWAGWLHISFFIAVLILGLIYVWKKGGLEWGPTHIKS
jgi:NADH-quinone oxidoreductase subunit A